MPAEVRAEMRSGSRIRGAQSGELVRLATYSRICAYGISTGVSTRATQCCSYSPDGESPSSADPLLVADVHDEYLVEQGVALIKSRHLKNIFLASHAETVLPLGGD
jgi:hypothetical protein